MKWELLFGKAAVVGWRSTFGLQALVERPSYERTVSVPPPPNDGHQYLEHFSTRNGVKIRDTVIKVD